MTAPGFGQHAEAFERCMGVGGVAVFAADTVYGLACDPSNREAVERLYALKRRPLQQPSAVMFFDLKLALAALPELPESIRSALHRLLPGMVTVLLPNPRERFALACGEDQRTLGLRVPNLPGLAGVRWPVLQSSANLTGGAAPRTLDEVPERLRVGADLVIDGGELPGTASTIVDLRRYEESGEWTVARPGGVGQPQLHDALDQRFHFDPDTYEEMIKDDIPGYDEFQQALVDASGTEARRVLELGTGTGETASRLLARHPGAELVGVDVSERMLAAAAARLPAQRVSLIVAKLQDPLPDGRFDLIASALCVHHLRSPEKQDLFRRLRAALAPGGRFVLADLIAPADPADAAVAPTPDYDFPDTLGDQVGWLAEAGFQVTVPWVAGDLAVLVATRSA